MGLQYFKSLPVLLLIYFLFHKTIAQDYFMEEDNISKIDEDLFTTRAAHPDLYLTTSEMIVRHGYNVKIHTVITGSGYKLAVHRIPNIGKPPILLNHGFLGSSDDFVMTGPGKALAYVLFDAGFDVWINNRRGNTYSKNHTTLDNKLLNYWNFNINDTATVDLPAIIDHILQNTTQTKLNYADYSLGAMEIFILMDTKPEYNSKIRQMHTLGPAPYIGTLGTQINVLKTYITITTWALSLLNFGEFQPHVNLNQQQVIDCADPDKIASFCTNRFHLVYSVNSKHIDKNIRPVLVNHLPAGSSAKMARHVGNIIDSDKFNKYDLGSAGNLQEYGQSTPPDYKLSKTTFPVYIYYATKDNLATPYNVDKVCRELGSNCKEKNLVSAPDFLHCDFLLGNNSKTLIFDRIVTTLKT